MGGMRLIRFGLNGQTLSLLLLVGSLGLAMAASRPNIVLILADDLGWSGTGSFGSDFYETPNIDHLATQGMRFTSGYAAAANCAPSRASLMSGQYTPAHGILYVGPGTYQEKYRKNNGHLKRFRMIQPRGQTVLVEGIQTMAENLKAAGYRTGMVGKWHLGMGDQHPAKRGFDVAIESHGKHWAFKTDPETEHPKDQYLSDFLAAQAVEFIKESKSEPFFLYYADFLVHKPFEAKESYLKHFAAKKPGKHQRSPMAGAMIKSLDDSVGGILKVLDQLGIADNTLVIFTSDNGGLSYEKDGLRDENTSNLPLRGRKGSEYDGGLRVPWIVRWPQHVAAGSENKTPIQHIDLFPTFQTLAGAKRPPQKLHGKNLIPLFKGASGFAQERDLFWYLPGYSAFHKPSVMVRRGKWKLVHRLDEDESELFNTSQDVGEADDRSKTEPELASLLTRSATAWLDDLNAPRMKPNPEFDPAFSRK
jgi:arylsulfatase A-like enzyme